MPELSLLDERLFSLNHARRRHEVSLPEIYAAIGRDEQFEFAALQAHQRHAWHAFLVQVAALAMHRGGRDAFPKDAEEWRTLLLHLTNGEPCAWSLVVEDLTKPAFMQPPVPEGTWEVLRSKATFPDEIDVLVTAKNHDVKATRIRSPRPEHWIFAIVSLQTTQGFLGAGNYGIARMNGGFASRPALGVRQRPDWSARVRRDVEVWRSQRAELVERFDYRDEGGAELLWRLPWDGKTSLASQECDPFFVEICRRVRVTREGAALVSRSCPTAGPRIAAKELRGNTGDIWTPIHVAEGKALTVTRRGFSFQHLHELLFTGDWRLGPAATVASSDGNAPAVHAVALVRGQGKTEGLHERHIPLPPRARSLLMSADGRSELGALSKARVETVATIRKSVLKPALLTLAQAAPEKLEFRDARMDVWLDALDDEVDELFFPRLFADIDAPDAAAADTAWTQEVLRLAERLLERAVQATPIPEARRYRAIAGAQRTFHGAARNRFPHAFARRTDEHNTRDSHHTHAR